MAKKFSFRFATLERMRELVEKNRKREFGVAVQKMNQLNDEYRQLGETRYASMQDLQKHQTGSLDMNALLNARSWISDLSFDGAKKQNEMVAQQQVINQRRRELLAASRDCKVMEKLNERDHETWQREVDLEEQKALDDAPHISLIDDERGNAGQTFMMVMGMASLALIVVTAALFAFGYLSMQKIEQIQWLLTDQGLFLNNDQAAVYAASDENRKKYEELFKKQQMATDGLAVNKSFQAQEKLLSKKRQALLEVEKRLRVMRAEIENEKNRIATMQGEVVAEIKGFEDRRKQMDDFAKSEGMQKAIKIFNNMEPATISETLTKGKTPSKNDLIETTSYIRMMREDLAAEVLSAMSVPWRQAVNEELKRVPVTEKGNE